MLRTLLLVFVLAVIVPLPASPVEPSAQDAGFTVVVDSGFPGEQIRRATLSSVFLKDVERWGNGWLTHPVDQSLNSPVRETFTGQVLTVPHGGLQFYWNAKIARGVLPPPVKETDEEILEYVVKTKGAIGYVSAHVAVPTGVKTLAVVD